MACALPNKGLRKQAPKYYADLIPRCVVCHLCLLRHLFQVTLIREYAQGPNALMYCLPTGALDPQRHKDMAECAARELSEEVQRSIGPRQSG